MTESRKRTGLSFASAIGFGEYRANPVGRCELEAAPSEELAAWPTSHHHFAAHPFRKTYCVFRRAGRAASAVPEKHEVRDMNVVIISTDEVTGTMRPVEEIQAEFGVGRSTLDKWVRQGRLTKYKLGYSILFDRDDVAAKTAELRGEPEVFAERIEALLKGGPRLSAEQKDRLAVLLGVKGVA